MERITATDPVGPARYGHEFRYRLAAGFIEPEGTVIDAACGTGYGYWILRKSREWEDLNYLGIDKVLTDLEVETGMYVRVRGMDLTLPSILDWLLIFDTFLGFETIEHLYNYEYYVSLAHQAKQWILVSTPVVPTVGTNPHHVHDFKPGDLREIFENADWEHYQTVQQPSELSEITILRRRT